MKERPILFNTEMVQAILDGRKTQTRRIIKPQPTLSPEVGFKWKGYMYGIGSNYDETVRNFTNWKCPLGRVDDQLYVRETFCYGRIDEYDSTEPASRYLYVDDSDYGDAYPIYKQMVLDEGINMDEVTWKPSLHMPKAISRIKLRIKKISVECINDISEEDAKAEGVLAAKFQKPNGDLSTMFKDYQSGSVSRHATAKDSFQSLWESVYGEQSWTENPWVWVVEFDVIDKPHDESLWALLGDEP